MNFKVLSLALLRVVVGATFLAHGLQKVQNIEGTIGFFASLGLAASIAYVVAWVELLGGLAVLLGVYSRWAAYALSLVMVGAIAMVKFDMGFVGGYELDLVLLASLLVIAFSGSGPYSVSGKMCGCGSCAMCGMK